MTPAEREEVYANLTGVEISRIAYAWYEEWGRIEQLPPPGDWSIWLIKTGRGWGKTRTGAGWVHQRALEFPKRWIAMAARTPADARDYMIEGPGDILRKFVSVTLLTVTLPPLATNSAPPNPAPPPPPWPLVSVPPSACVLVIVRLLIATLPEKTKKPRCTPRRPA